MYYLRMKILSLKYDWFFLGKIRLIINLFTVVCSDNLQSFYIWIPVGDLHGDLYKTRSALELAGVLSSDGQDAWIGGETVCLKFHMHIHSVETK